MPPAITVSAVPFELLGLRERTEQPEAAARASAFGLDAFLAAAGRTPGLGTAVRDHLRRTGKLADDAAAAGMALLLAGGDAGALALALHASGLRLVGSSAAAIVLAGALGLDAEGAGVERPNVDPQVVAALVAALGEATVATVARTHPHLIGPVDGMPIHLRYEANRILAERAADRFDLLGLHRRADVLRDLAAPGRQLLYVDPGRGHAAEVVGDLSTASAVSVVVPGMGNELEHFDVVLDKAVALRDAAAALRPGEELVTVAWLGYDSPGVPEFVLDDAARAGGRHLARFLDGLTAGGLDADATRTVIGHSYGSVVTGFALRDGVDVDAVAVTGSPGMGASSASELGDTPIYALGAQLDPVAAIERFGTSPTDDDFGATELSTGSGRWHAGYFDDGSVALTNLALVATGRAAEASRPPASFASGFNELVEDLRGMQERPVDDVQRLLEEGAGVASDLTDWTEGFLPDPVAEVVDATQDAAGVAFEVGNGLVDGVQRVTSPGFWGDLIAG